MRPADGASALLPRAGAPLRALRRGAARIEALRPAAVLGPLVAVQLAVVAAFALRARHNGWLYAAPAAGMRDWTAAWALGHLWVTTAAASYGLAVLEWPLALAFGGSLPAALPVIVVCQAAIGVPVVLLATYGIASRIAGRLFGYAAAIGWIVAPLLSLGWFYEGRSEFEGLVYEGYRTDVLDLVVPNALGLTSSAAFTSLVVLAVAAWLLVRCLDTGAWSDLLPGGLLSGLAVGIEPGNVLFLAAPVLALLVARRPRQAAGFLAAVLPALGTLALWRLTGPGHGTGFGAPFDRETFRLNLINLKAAGWSVLLLEWIAVAGMFAIVRKAPAKGVLVAVWFLGVFAFGLGRARVRGTGVFRLLEPGYPAFVLLAAALLLLVPTWGRRRREAAPPPSRLRPTRGLAAAAVALALYPLVIVALSSRAPRDRVVVAPNGEAAPVTDALAARVGREAGHALLDWSRPAAGGTTLSYRIYRGSGPGCAPGAGRDCLLDMEEAATVRLPAPEAFGLVDLYAWTDPEAGRHWYRVAAVADGDPDRVGGDLLLAGPAVRAP